MVTSAAATVSEYLASLPPDRRSALEAVRKVIRKRLPPGYVEGMQFGMIGWAVPLSRYPDTYNGQPLGIAALASQKGYMSVYLMGVYGDPALRRWFEDAYHATGKRLDMGKSCVRFRTLDDLALDVVGEAVARVSVDDLVAQAEAARGGKAKAKPKAKAPAKAPAAKAKARAKR